MPRHGRGPTSSDGQARPLRGGLRGRAVEAAVDAGLGYAEGAGDLGACGVLGLVEGLGSGDDVDREAWTSGRRPGGAGCCDSGGDGSLELGPYFINANGSR